MADIHLLVQDPVSGQFVNVASEDNGDGTRRLLMALASGSVTLNASELEIGHVVLKNNDTEDHADVGTDNHLNVVTRNRDDFKVRVLNTGTVDNEKVGPAQAVADGQSVLVVADVNNAAAVKVGSVGETGVADQFFELQPGDALPTKLSVTNMNKIAAQSPTASQKIFLIAEI